MTTEPRGSGLSVQRVMMLWVQSEELVEMDGRKLRKYGVGCGTSGTVGTVDPRSAYGTYGNVGRRFFVMFPGWGNQRQTLL